MRPIDADALEPSEVYMNYGFTRIVYMDDIDEMPTVDAVPVVRCKDCKFYDKQTFMGHSMGWASCSGRFADVDDNGLRFKIPSEDWFCADGERREDGTN